MPGQQVSAADLVRNFAHWREAAQQDAVQITHHGRETHVLLNAAEYARLVALASAAPATPQGATPEAELEAARGLAEWIDEAVVLCDREGLVLSANRVASALCRRSLADFVGKPLRDALPHAHGSLLEIHARRTMLASEPTSADIPSPFEEGSWLRFHSFPLGTLNVFMFRDITEEVAHHRLADVKGAILRAMGVLGPMLYARVSVRGTIDRVNDRFCAMLGLAEARVIGVSMADFVAIGHRAGFRADLEATMRGGAPHMLDSSFLTNRGAVAEVRLAMVQLQGAYGCEGAVIVGFDIDALPTMAADTRESDANTAAQGTRRAHG